LQPPTTSSPSAWPNPRYSDNFPNTPPAQSTHTPFPGSPGEFLSAVHFSKLRSDSVSLPPKLPVTHLDLHLPQRPCSGTTAPGSKNASPDPSSEQPHMARIVASQHSSLSTKISALYRQVFAQKDSEAV